MNYEAIEHDLKMALIVEQQEYNLVSMLKPKIYIDGNQWCVMYGENIQEGICGFGDTIYKAVIEFNKQFSKPLNSPSNQNIH